MTYDDTLTELRQRTTPSPHAVARVRGRLQAHLSPATEELSALPSPTDVMIQRVRSRLRTVLQARTRRRPWPLLAALGLLGSVALAAWMTLDTAPAAVRHTLSGAATTRLAPGVEAQFDGTGTVTGTEATLQIRWEVGRLELSVDGPEVTVITSEGRAHVGKAAHLGVERSALGTAWSAADGIPWACDAARQGDVCLPTTASGLLGRGRALQTGGADPQEVLETFVAGLDTEGVGAIRAELFAAQIQPLLTLGRDDEALVAVRAALEEGVEGMRTEPLHRTAARLLLLQGDCEAAVPHLRALATPTPAELEHLQTCSSKR